MTSPATRREHDPQDSLDLDLDELRAELDGCTTQELYALTSDDAGRVLEEHAR